MTEIETPTVKVIKDPGGKTVLTFMMEEGVSHGTAEMTAMPQGSLEYPLPSRSWWITRVFIQKGHRRRGFGRALVRELQMNSRAISLVVSPGGYNTPPEVLKAFYESCGFEEQKDHVFVWIPKCGQCNQSSEGVRKVEKRVLPLDIAKFEPERTRFENDMGLYCGRCWYTISGE